MIDPTIILLTIKNYVCIFVVCVWSQFWWRLYHRYMRDLSAFHWNCYSVRVRYRII